MEAQSRSAEILEATAGFYRDYLWAGEIGEAIRARLAREGVDEETLRAFEVGYVPGEHGLLEEHLARIGFSDAELYEAGIAMRSHRGRVHSQFRSRIMFPIRDLDGGMLGFAGMATNPGPSWPLWLISPDRGRFRRRSAVFALDRAAGAIADARRAVVFRDCIEVLREHQSGRCEAVAVIRSSPTREHVARISAALGEEPSKVSIERPEGAGELVIRPAPEGGAVGGTVVLEGESESQERVRSSGTEVRPDPIKTRGQLERVILQLARVAVGIGIPLAWLAIVRPDLDATGGADPAFVGAIGGVALTYVALAIVSAVGAARVRDRSRARRMRGAWSMGAGEWQPLAWTYHLLEDILVAAAVISAVVCIVMFVAIGGFTN